MQMCGGLKGKGYPYIGSVTTLSDIRIDFLYSHVSLGNTSLAISLKWINVVIIFIDGESILPNIASHKRSGNYKIF